MNALELLKQDHQKVAELFKQFTATENIKQQWSLFDQIRTELETHAHIEETILYPELEKHEDLIDLMLEAYEEHKQVKTLLREVSALTPTSERFEAKVKVMKENVEHHVEEEETEMFLKVRQHYSSTQLEQLGKQLETAKKTYGQKHYTTSTKN